MKPKEFIDRKTSLAERELSAFIAAVSTQYGREQAKISAEDWLKEFDQLRAPSPCDIKNWRAITIAASARLAERLSVPATIAALSLRAPSQYETTANTNV